jgi:hypothetical protein
MPVLTVGANTYLYERVHSFPDVVDFGTWRAAAVGGATMTLMIHQEGGSGFKAQLSSDVPGLSFKSERGPKGDQYQVEITLVSRKSARWSDEGFHRHRYQRLGISKDHCAGQRTNRGPLKPQESSREKLTSVALLSRAHARN